MSGKAIYWFQTDLRLHDQPILSKLHKSYDELLCIYVIPDRWFKEPFNLGFNRLGPYRKRFLYETLIDLNNSLQRLGQRLVVKAGDPSKVLSNYYREYNIDKVFTHDQYAFEELQDLEKLQMSIGKRNLIIGNTKLMVSELSLPFTLEELPFSFTSFRKKVEDVFKVDNDDMNCTSLPPALESLSGEDWPAEIVPDLNEGVSNPETAFPFKGGEYEALSRLKEYIWDTENILHYKSTRNGMVGVDYSSKFSPWLSNGSLSPRRVYYEIKRFEESVKSNISTYWLVFELLWRDFFQLQSLKFQSDFFKVNGIKHREKEWNYDQKLFEQWRSGNTGNDFIDANMIELLSTGFMSNRGRQNVASWLAHEYKIDWRWGAYWFEHCLVDHDPSSNYGNWMYISGIGNDSVADRRFNAELQAHKYDRQHRFVNLWLN
ncbi:DASH family cryptochrome [Marinigracilibium pacificum]|uniref:Cryptochrome DASH n=1 Tax=Marinigracilibium pacificum TaxID=2729599 RepID=A0A848IXF1_9BACT|nr:DASH family cryptochrome [Marinigracilibium pacificum]NMM46940.1 DASH family cryptochrome [Marinigracilibium pacificum]